MKILNFKEHENKKPKEDASLIYEVLELHKSEKLFIGNPDKYMGVPTRLGISNNGDSLQASYYIGATWVKKECEIAAVVMPKIERLDYLNMFAVALNVRSSKESAYFSKCYGIDFKEDKIELNGTPNLLTPLIIFHFISLIELLLKKGLKKGYIYREENLKSKIKGKVKIPANIKENILKQRLDKVYCAFSEYTVDIPENRLLKKALEFSARYLYLLKGTVKRHKNLAPIIARVNKCLYPFENISDNINIKEIKSVATNKIFSYYAEAIKVAKMILRNFDYSIDNVSKENSKTFPFWIDMPRLFELYVYNKLYEAYGDVITFQERGKRNVADFLKKDEKLIIDAKYKPKYENVENIEIEDIRELSGYARDLKILEKLDIKGEKKKEIVPKCMIIYSEKMNPAVIEDGEEKNNFDDSNEECKEFDKTMPLVAQATEIANYNEFYLLSIKLPTFE